MRILAPTRTPTATLPIAAIPAVSQGAAATPIVVSVTTRARLRTGPGTDFAIVTVVPADHPVEVVARNQTGEWVMLESEEWIAAFLLNDLPNTLPTLEPTMVP